MEVIAAVVLALGVLAALWMLQRRATGFLSTPLSEEELEALDGAVVLLADDSVTLQKVVELVFMDTPARVICAADGEAAAELLASKQIDVVIADVHMPKKSGYEICESAKQVDPGISVILLVGAFEPFDEDRSRECGADETFKKPFDSAELARATSRLLQRRRA